MSVICVCAAASGAGSFYELFARSSRALCVGFAQVLEFPPTQSKNTSRDFNSPPPTPPHLDVNEWRASCDKLMICARCSPAFHPAILQQSPMTPIRAEMR